MSQEKILITGANGQLGTVLSTALRNKFGSESIITSDLFESQTQQNMHELLDATDLGEIGRIIEKHRITQIYHLAAILSANGERNPIGTWDINMKSLLNVLEVSVKYNISKLFFPSSIAVYGSDAQKWATPQNEVLNPSTVYGMSKAAAENWSKYYFDKYALDVRSLRYPGVIGHQSLPGGGTTDYAVDIYHKAVNNETFTCYLNETTTLPMIYMEDAIGATVSLMDEQRSNITIRTSYNVQAISVTPRDIAASIRKFLPDFKIEYRPDDRQKIADSWPYSLNDTDARNDWAWLPKFQLDDITSEMLKKLEQNKNYVRNYKRSTTERN